jgi:hypothetical protein
MTRLEYFLWNGRVENEAVVREISSRLRSLKRILPSLKVAEHIVMFDQLTHITAPMRAGEILQLVTICRTAGKLLHMKKLKQEKRGANCTSRAHRQLWHPYSRISV